MAQIIKKYQTQMKHIGANGVEYKLYPRTLATNTKVPVGTVGNDVSEEILSYSLRKIYEKFDTLKPVSDTSGYISTVTYASTAKTIYPTVKVKKTLKTNMAEKATSAFGVMCDHNSNVLLTTYINFNNVSPVKSSDDYNSTDEITKSRFITPSGVQSMFSNYTSKLGNYYTTASKLSTARYSNTTTKAIYYNLTTDVESPDTSGATIERGFCKRSDAVNILVSSSDTSDETLIASSVSSSFTNNELISLTNGEISQSTINSGVLESKSTIQHALGLANTLKFASRSLIPQVLYSSTNFGGNVDVKNGVVGSASQCKLLNQYAIFEDGASHVTTGVPLIDIVTIYPNSPTILPFELERTVFFIVSLPIAILRTEYEDETNSISNKQGYVGVTDMPGLGSMIFMHPAGSKEVHLITSTELTPPGGVGEGLSKNNIYIEDGCYKFSFTAEFLQQAGGIYTIGGWNIMALIV